MVPGKSPGGDADVEETSDIVGQVVPSHVNGHETDHGCHSHEHADAHGLECGGRSPAKQRTDDKLVEGNAEDYGRGLPNVGQQGVE